MPQTDHGKRHGLTAAAPLAKLGLPESSVNMYSYNQQMGEIHALLAWCSVALFLVRGLAFQFEAKWATDSRLSVLVFSVNLLLAVTGLSLWVLLYLNPLRDGWLMGKLLVLVVFAACSHWAMGRGELRAVGYAAGLLALAYMMAVSITRQPGLGLF